MKKTPAQWQAIFTEQKASGLSISAYCRENKIAPSAFSSAKDRLVKKVKPTTTKNTFIPIKTTQTEQPIGLLLKAENYQLQLPGNIDPQWLAQLLRGL